MLCASRGWKYEPVRKCGEGEAGEDRGRIFSPASGRNDLPQSPITRCLVEHSIKTNMPLRYNSVDIEEGPTVYQSFSKKEFICNGAHLPFLCLSIKIMQPAMPAIVLRLDCWARDIGV